MSRRFPVVQSANCKYAVNYPCTFPCIRLCSMYFIVNFVRTIRKDSLHLLDARPALFHFAGSSKLLGLTLSRWIWPISLHGGPTSIWASSLGEDSSTPHKQYIPNIKFEHVLVFLLLKKSLFW